MATERRQRRSDVPEEAVRWYLEGLARRPGMRALVLADDDGTVTGVGDGTLDLGRIAAAGRACVRGVEADAELDAACQGEDLYAHAWEADGRRFTLTSLGARVPRVREVIETVSRISP